jgi:hypothetical protein
MLASMPAGSDVMVVRSVRLPLELDGEDHYDW